MQCLMCLFLTDLRQELAVRERTTDRMSAPSSPTSDIDKMDSAVQASLSLPATPVGKGLEHPFISPKGQCFPHLFTLFIIWLPSLSETRLGWGNQGVHPKICIDSHVMSFIQSSNLSIKIWEERTGGNHLRNYNRIIHTVECFLFVCDHCFLR